MHVLGLIPARGGSKGIPGKNLAEVAGRSLLAWTAAAAQASARLSRTVLSTDDPTIAAAGRDLGLEVPFLREPALAGDETPIVPVIADVLARLAGIDGYAPDVVVLLQPTSPLRRAGDIDGAVDRLVESGADTVVSIVEVPHQYNPASVLVEDGGVLSPWAGGTTVTRRQDKPRVFARNGPAVLALRPAVLVTGSLYGGVTRGFVMRPEDSVDIDTPWDLELAGWLLGRRG
ncbi:MAG: acylneuraminate cytidylyltransferase family protein [Vicinamibacterales bacterium]